MQYNYSDTELKHILDSLTFIIDSREKENNHIINYLDKKRIPHKTRKLNFGDYSFLIPANTELGIMKDITFESDIVIERKSSLIELSGNLTKERERFEAELIRSKGAKFLLLIENASYKDIVEHKYNTQYEPKSFIATLKTFESRYNVSVNYINNGCSGNFIYYTFYYFLREYLKSREAVKLCISAN